MERLLNKADQKYLCWKIVIEKKKTFIPLVAIVIVFFIPDKLQQGY